MTEQIKILLNGAAGKMGRAMAAGILGEADMQLVGAVDRSCIGCDIGELSGGVAIGVKVSDDLAASVKRCGADVMLDFTTPEAVMRNIRTALSAGLPCVVGTTGLTAADLEEAEALALANDAPLFVAPNFALTAVLMMRFAAEAAKYFPHYEIIEIHNDRKMDAPSGTALYTAQMIGREREPFAQGALNSFETLPGCRGGDYQGARIHSVRLPGVVAIQEVLFGGPGQMLSIRQASTTRECFFPGVALALRRIRSLHGLVQGLEKLL